MMLRFINHASEGGYTDYELRPMDPGLKSPIPWGAAYSPSSLLAGVAALFI